MSDVFFLIVGIIVAGVGLLLIMSKVMACIKCTVPVNATVVKLEKKHTYFRGIEHTSYRPIVGYVVDGRSYTEKADFRSYRETKYQVGSEIKVRYNTGKPEEIRFVGHPFPLPLGLAIFFIGVVLIFFYFM